MTDNKKTIFISYGRDQENPEDVEMVRRVKSDLEKEGFTVLMDEEQLRTTHDWAVELEKMILRSQWVLYFITPYSARRPDGFCLRELTHSLAHRVPIAPVMIRQEVLPIEICRIQYLDLQALKSEEDYRKKIEEIITVLSGEKELGFEGEHTRVLTELEPIKFETTIRKHIHKFVGRKWVYEEVDRWLEEENSRVLWLQAEAGFGKSAIATYIATTHPSALSVHFCQYDYAESKDPREMLKVLIYELSTQLVEYHKILQTLHLKDALSKSAEHIFTQLLLEPLQQISKPDKKYFFVIDALDEAVSDGKNEIVELISNRFLDLPSWLGIVATSRAEPELARKLKKFNPIVLETQDSNNLKDLEIYLKENQNIEDNEIIDALVQKSEGNILYLKSLFDLEIIKDNELDINSIELLPATMEGFYLTYFERKFEDIDEYEEKYLGFINILILSRIGIPISLLKHILNISEREIFKIIDKFGSLLNKNNEVLTFYHKTLYDWLNNYSISGRYSADEELGIDYIGSYIEHNYSFLQDNYFSLGKKVIKEKDVNFGLFESIDSKYSNLLLVFLDILYRYNPKSNALQELINKNDLLFDMENRQFIDKAITNKNIFFYDRKKLLESLDTVFKTMKNEGLESQFYLNLDELGNPKGYTVIARQIAYAYELFLETVSKYKNNIEYLSIFQRYYFNLHTFYFLLKADRVGNMYWDLVDMNLDKNKEIIEVLEKMGDRLD